MSKINSLTSKQQALLVEWRKEWFKIGTSTEPADRPLAEKRIMEAYKLIGKKPVPIIWCDSPLIAELCLNILSQRTSLGKSLRASLEDSLWASLRDSLRASLSDSLRKSLRASLENLLRDSLENSVGSSL